MKTMHYTLLILTILAWSLPLAAAEPGAMQMKNLRPLLPGWPSPSEIPAEYQPFGLLAPGLISGMPSLTLTNVVISRPERVPRWGDDPEVMRRYQEQWEAYRKGSRMLPPTLYPSRIAQALELDR